MRCRATIYYARVNLPPWHLRRRQQDSPPSISRYLVSQRAALRVLASRVAGNAISMLWSRQTNVRATERYGVGDGNAARAARFASTSGVLIANGSEEISASER
jgi:hypothetical protein